MGRSERPNARPELSPHRPALLLAVAAFRDALLVGDPEGVSGVPGFPELLLPGAQGVVELPLAAAQRLELLGPERGVPPELGDHLGGDSVQYLHLLAACRDVDAQHLHLSPHLADIREDVDDRWWRRQRGRGRPRCRGHRSRCARARAGGWWPRRGEGCGGERCARDGDGDGKVALGEIMEGRQRGQQERVREGGGHLEAAGPVLVASAGRGGAGCRMQG